MTTPLMLMARHVLGGPAEEGRASYQIALSVCAECGRGHQHANGELIPVSAEVVAMAECDGQHLGVTAPPVASRDPAKDERAHVGVARVRAHVGARAKQTVSPATRRAVLRRDHERCVVPGCRNARFLDVHHVALRSEGGGNDTDNLTTLCGAHHRATHRGELVVSGSVAAGIRFRHADGRRLRTCAGAACGGNACESLRRPAWPGFSRRRDPSSAGRVHEACGASDEPRTRRTRCAGQTDPARAPNG